MADRFPAAGSRLRAFSSAGSGVSLSKNFDFSIAIKSPSVRFFFAAQRSFPWHLRGKGGLYFLRLLCGVAPTSSLAHSHSPEARLQRVAESFLACLEPCAATRVFDWKTWSIPSVPMSTPRCPHCDQPMSRAPRSLRPIFGDISAFECPPCDHILLIKVPLDPTQHVGQISSQDLSHNYPDKRS